MNLNNDIVDSPNRTVTQETLRCYTASATGGGGPWRVCMLFYCWQLRKRGKLLVEAEQKNANFIESEMISIDLFFSTQYIILIVSCKISLEIYSGTLSCNLGQINLLSFSYQFLHCFPLSPFDILFEKILPVHWQHTFKRSLRCLYNECIKYKTSRLSFLRIVSCQFLTLQQYNTTTKNC